MDEPKLPLEPVGTDNPWEKPESCRACPLFLEPGPVWGVGNPNAKILYVGEAPGAEEVDAPKHRPMRFKPFIGGAGRIRNKLLEHAGVEKDYHLFTTNCVKCRPPNNRLPTLEETYCCAPFLIKEIADVNPNVIIAAGEVALNVLTGKKKIGLWRGVPTAGPKRTVDEAARASSPLSPSDPNVIADVYKVFPTWHPSFIMRAQYNWPFAVHDYARARVESDFAEIRRVPYVIVRDPNAAVDGGDLLADARKRGAATFDFETTGLSAQRDSILMCGIVAREDESRVYDWTGGTQLLFQELLDSPEVTIIGQNVLNFDLPFAEEKGFRIPWHRVFDTMTAFHLTNASYGQTTLSTERKGGRQPGAEKDLAFIASNHTDIEYWKSRDDYRGDLRRVCGIDCIATDRSALHPVHGIMKELERYGMEDLYWKHVLPVHPILKRMTKRGVRIDEDRAVRWGILLEQNADRMEAELKTFLGEPTLNLNSSPQLMAVVYDKLKLPVQWKEDKKRGKVRTLDSDALDNLVRLRPDSQPLQALSNIRNLRKMKSTYVDPVMEGVDGFVHPSFGVSKAATGRFNSWNPNAQNVPEQMRDIWIPDSDDHVLLSSDWSQIEWRLAMVMSGDPVGLALLKSGVDNHRAVAAETLSKRIEDVTEEERYASKFIVYGLGYGRGAESIAQGHDLPLPFVVSFIDRFFKRFRVFNQWRGSNLEFVKKNFFLANPFMRRRWWYTWQVTEVYNFPQQSTGADMMYRCIIDLDDALPPDATLRLTVHDEVVINCLKENVRSVIECVRDVMQQKWPQIVEASARPDVVEEFYPDGWHCPSDIHVGTTWKMCKTKDPVDTAARKVLEKHLGIV